MCCEPDLARFTLALDGPVLGRVPRCSGFKFFSEVSGSPYSVTYNNRSLLINGEPSLFASGVIHPPRFSGPAEWGPAFASAKNLGLNAIQLYIFANAHQPTKGDWIWSGNLNVTKFIAMAGEADLFVNLRIGG